MARVGQAQYDGNGGNAVFDLRRGGRKFEGRLKSSFSNMVINGASLSLAAAGRITPLNLRRIRNVLWILIKSPRMIFIISSVGPAPAVRSVYIQLRAADAICTPLQIDNKTARANTRDRSGKKPSLSKGTTTS